MVPHVTFFFYMYMTLSIVISVNFMLIYKQPTMDQAINGLHNVCKKYLEDHHVASDKINDIAYDLNLNIIASSHENELRLAVNDSVTIDDIITLAELIEGS